MTRSSTSMLRILTVLLPIALLLIGCDSVVDGAGNETSLEVQYHVMAADQSGATHAAGIFYVDEKGRETTLNDVRLPWSYEGTFKADARVAAAIEQRGLHSRNGKIVLHIYRDGQLSVELDVESGGGSTNGRGYDSDPDAHLDRWGMPDH